MTKPTAHQAVCNFSNAYQEECKFDLAQKRHAQLARNIWGTASLTTARSQARRHREYYSVDFFGNWLLIFDCYRGSEPRWLPIFYDLSGRDLEFWFLFEFMFIRHSSDLHAWHDRRNVSQCLFPGWINEVLQSDVIVKSKHGLRTCWSRQFQWYPTTYLCWALLIPYCGLGLA